MNNRKCYTCGKEYHYCYSCPDELRPTYLAMFCCEECLKVFDTLCDYDSQKITAQKAYETIKDYIPEDLSNYSEGCQKLIKQIKEELKPKTVSKEDKPSNQKVVPPKQATRNKNNVKKYSK